MSGQMKSYEKYLQSLKETPGPVDPPTDKSINLRQLYKYLQETGKNASDLSDEEYKQFIFLINENRVN